MNMFLLLLKLLQYLPEVITVAINAEKLVKLIEIHEPLVSRTVPAQHVVEKPIPVVAQPVVKAGSPQPLQPSEDPKVEGTLQQIIKENS